MVALGQRLVGNRDPIAAFVRLDLGKGPVLGGDGDRRAGLGLAGDHGVAVLVDAYDIELRLFQRLAGRRWGSAGRSFRRGRRLDRNRRLGRGGRRGHRGRRLGLLEQVGVGAAPQGVKDQCQTDDGYGNNTGHERYRFVTMAT